MPTRVYLHPKYQETAYVRSAHHRAYVGNGPIHAPGGSTQSEVVILEFWGGVARDVDETVFQRFKDAGIADASPPRLRDEY